MSALWRDQGEPGAQARVLRPMSTAHLDAVLAIEAAAYEFPWSRGNFIDSIAAGYPARVLFGSGSEVLGYVIAMAGVDEMHLLNITVAPVAQGRGHARFLIHALTVLCREHAALKLWLEVRASNARARAMYRRLGFVEVGVRKGYYPAPLAGREDAVVMSLAIESQAGEANDALG